MILSFKDARAERLFKGERVKELVNIESQTRRHLVELDSAVSLLDLQAMRGNRFEVLRGDRKGQFSIRINRQYRICFTWDDKQKGPSNVEIVDYH